jgi:isochorismate hydrolase
MQIVSNILETVPEAALKQASVRKERSALLVIDMQKYFYSIAEPIIGNLSKVILACRDAVLPIFYMQHGYEDPDKDSGMLGQWWGDPIVVGTEAWEFMDEIAPRTGDRVIRKKRYSAFYQTDLDGALRDLGIKNVIVGGVMTNLCCETTARDAFVRDFRVFFLADGTATVSEEYHLASLRNLAYGFAYLKQCADIVEEFKERYE